MATAAIRTDGLTKRYDGVAALDHLDLEVARGEVIGFLGPNGAGKTTTIRLLLGLIQPTEGRGAIFGLDCQRQPVEAHRHLAFVAGEANLWPSLTGAETLHLLGRVQGRTDTAYRDELIDRFELDPTKKVRAYSKGNRQKVVLIGALMVRPDLLVLDEPTSGLDPLMEQAFRHCIGEARGTRPVGLSLVPHHERGGGSLRPCGDPPAGSARRDGHAGPDAPPQRADRRSDLRRPDPRPVHRVRSELGGDRRPRGPLPGPRVGRAIVEGPGRLPASPVS